MKREIKFRARWVDTLEVVDDFEYEYLISAISDENFIVEQYTGLKDRNGIEIYEGDIVKLADLNYKVFWDEWKWNASCPYYHQYHHPQFGDRFFSNARCSEVIGNIHENADLLK